MFQKLVNLFQRKKPRHELTIVQTAIKSANDTDRQYQMAIKYFSIKD